MKKRKLFGILLIAVLCFFIGNNVTYAQDAFYNITGLYFKSNEVSVDGKAYVDLYMNVTSSTKVTGFFNCTTYPNKEVSMKLDDINTRNPYFDTTKVTVPGSSAVHSVQVGETCTLVKLKVEDSKATITYSMVQNEGLPYMNPLGRNVITKKPSDILTNVQLLDSEVEVDGKLKIKLDTDLECSNISVVLQNKNVPSMSAIVYLNKVSDNTYELNLSKGSNKLTPGDYRISSVNLFVNSSVTSYTLNATGNNLPLNYDLNITIKNKDILKNVEVVGNSTIEPDGKLTLKLDTDANCNYISVNVQNKDVPTTNAIVYLNKVSDNTYELNLSKGSNKLTTGDYYISSIYMFEGNTTTQYSLKSTGNNILPLKFNLNFTIKSKDILKNAELTGNTTIGSDGKLTLKLDTEIKCDYISVGVQNKDDSSMYSIIYLNKVSNNTYELNLTNGSNKLTTGDYQVTNIFLFENASTVLAQYSLKTTGNGILPLKYNLNFTIKDSKQNNENNNNEQIENVLESISIGTTKAKLNEKVSVNLKTSKILTSATLIFSNDNESMTLNLKDLNTSNTYFVIPFTTSAGTYNLDYAILKDVDGKEYQYRKGEDYFTIKHFDFSSSLTVENEIAGGDLLNIDNSKLSTDVLRKLNELESNIVIEVNAEVNPIISKELFETIKESNKTIIIKHKDLEWTFNGLDIKNPKEIDVSINIYNVTEDNNISSVVEDGFVLDFADNDKLPGKCLIKIYNSETIAKIMNKNNANVYYYNEQTKKFEAVELNTEYNSDGYYEFYISHNSKYVITTNKINNKYLSNNTVDNNQSSIDPMIVIAIPFLIIILLLLISIDILVNKEKNVKNNKK